MAVGDGGAAERPADPPGYEAWWYRECVVADGTCPADTCYRNPVTVAPSKCGPYQSLTVGCVPRSHVLSGWYCWMRISNGELIFSELPPEPMDGFEMCADVGNVPPDPKIVCPDGGVD